MTDGGGADAALLAPGAAVEDAGDGRHDDVLPVEDAATLVEVRESEEGRGDEERPAWTEAAFEEILYPAAEEDFFRQGDGEEAEEPDGRDEARVGDVLVQREKLKREAEGNGEDGVEEEFAEADAEVGEAKAEVKTDAGEAAESEDGVKGGVEQDELADDGGSGRPGGLQEAEVDGEAEGNEDEGVQPVTELAGVGADGEEFERGPAGRYEEIKQ